MSVRAMLALTCAAVLGCNGDIEPVSWAPIDIDGLEDQMENPTAPLDEATLAELLATPTDEIDLIRGLLFVGRSIVETSGAGDMEVMTRDLDVNLAGTQVYIRIACPGPVDMTPDPEFHYGTLTVYSATLTKETVDTWGAQGDMLGVLDECVIGRYTLDGRMRMYYDVIRDLLAMDFEVEWAREGAEGEFALPATHQRDAVNVEDEHARVLFTTEASGTLVLEQSIDIEPTEYRIVGSDGEIVCDGLADPPCPPL